MNENIHIKLFITGQTPASITAKLNLHEILDNLNKEQVQYRIEITNILDQPEEAMKHNVFTTPTLVRLKPEPVIQVIGTLENKEKVLKILLAEE